MLNSQEQQTVAQPQPKFARARHGVTTTGEISKGKTQWHNHKLTSQEQDTVTQPQAKSARARHGGATTD